MRFEGRCVLVTGAASGIGAATARRLLVEGATVVGVDVGPIPDLPSDGDHGAAGRFVGVEADVRDEGAVAEAVAVAAARTGRLDGVFHAAGVAGGGPVHLLDAAEWDRVVGVNLTGTFHVCKHAVRQMLAQDRVGGERGAIVNVASVEGIEGTAGGSAYNASKGAVVLLTKNLALDYGPAGVRANALCPGLVDTPMMQAVTDVPGMERFRALMVEEHALRRHAAPDEVASVAAFLLSADASFVTGHALVADGGYSAGRDHGLTRLLGLAPG